MRRSLRGWPLLLASLLACKAGPAQQDCECASVMLEPPPEPEVEAAPEVELILEVEPTSAGPRLRILGIAQDGGLPHTACDCPRCDAARQDPLRASPVASVALIGSAPGDVWLVDATPDLPRQLDLLADVRELQPGRVDRSPVRGIMLTHAHMGHYLGLAQLGYEAVSTEPTQLLASARMVEFLAGNAPWDQLVRLGQLVPQAVEPGQVIELVDGLKVEPLRVPHRGEYTDTYGWYLSGPKHRALYIPDTDPWAKWTADIDAALEGVDLLLIDGTFYSGDELPGRDLTEIGHPLMTDTMDRLAAHLGHGMAIWFIHLNHSNPTLEPGSMARRELERRGFEIARLGAEFHL